MRFTDKLRAFPQQKPNWKCSWAGDADERSIDDLLIEQPADRRPSTQPFQVITHPHEAGKWNKVGRRVFRNLGMIDYYSRRLY